MMESIFIFSVTIMASKPMYRNRRAYQCLRCWRRDGTVYIEQRCRVRSHILKKHVTLDDTPYYCSLCLFRCFSKEELDRHITKFVRHGNVLREKGIPHSPSMLVENPRAPPIGDRDLVALSSEESAAYWEQVAKKKDPLLQAVEEVFPDGFPEDTPSHSGLPSPTSEIQQPAVTQLVVSQALPGSSPAQPVAGTVPAESTQTAMMIQLQQAIMGAFQPLLGALSKIPTKPAAEDGAQPEPAAAAAGTQLEQAAAADARPEPATAEAMSESASQPEEEDIMTDILPPGAPSPRLDRERSPSPAPSSVSSSSSSSSSSSASSRFEDRKLLRELKAAVNKNSEALLTQGEMLNRLSEFLMKSGGRRASTRTQGTQTDEGRKTEKRKRTPSPDRHRRRPDPRNRLGWSRRR